MSQNHKHLERCCSECCLRSRCFAIDVLVLKSVRLCPGLVPEAVVYTLKLPDLSSGDTDWQKQTLSAAKKLARFPESKKRQKVTRKDFT